MMENGLITQSGSIQLSDQGSPSPHKIHYYKGGNINSNFILENLGKHHFN